MSTFNRLFDLAAKALDKTGSSSTPAPRAAPASGAGDWRSMVRSAADALTGDAPKRRRRRVRPRGVGTTPPPASARTRRRPSAHASGVGRPTPGPACPPGRA